MCDTIFLVCTCIMHTFTSLDLAGFVINDGINAGGVGRLLQVEVVVLLSVDGVLLSDE